METFEEALQDILFQTKCGTEHYTVQSIYNHCKLDNPHHLSAISRNLYHLAYSRVHLIFSAGKIAFLLTECIPEHMRSIWEDVLTVPIITFDIEDDEMCVVETSYEAVYFYGLLASYGIVDPYSRLLYMQSILPKYTNMFIVTLPLLLFYGHRLNQRDPALFEFIISNIRSISFDKAEELTKAIDLQAPFPPSERFHISGSEHVSSTASLLMTIAKDDIYTFKRLAQDVNAHIGYTILNPSTMITEHTSLLETAAFFGSEEIYDWLSSEGASHTNSFTEFDMAQYAAAGGSTKIYTHYIPESLFTAISYHRHDIFLHFVQNNSVDFNALSKEGLHIYHYACATNNIKVVKLMIQRGVSPYLTTDTEGSSPLELACSYDCGEILRLFLDAFPHITKSYFETLLKSAVACDSIEVIKILISEYPQFIDRSVLSNLKMNTSASGWKIPELLEDYVKNRNI